MMTLTTVSKNLNNYSALVYWRVGTKRNGIVRVDSFTPDDDIDVIAELCAIRHLIYEQHVFNVVPSTGTGIELRVSKGAIKKLINDKSDKKSAKIYSYYIKDFLDGALITVSKDMEYMADINNTRISRINIEDGYRDARLPVQTKIGDIYLTKHSIKRFEERLDLEHKPKNIVSSLIKHLNNPELKQIGMPEHVYEQKANKYGTADNVEIWNAEDAAFRFLVLKNEESKERTLVTVFKTPKVSRSSAQPTYKGAFSGGAA